MTPHSLNAAAAQISTDRPTFQGRLQRARARLRSLICGCLSVGTSESSTAKWQPSIAGTGFGTGLLRVPVGWNVGKLHCEVATLNRWHRFGWGTGWGTTSQR